MGAIRVCGFAPKLADECLVSDFQAIFRCALQHASVNSRRPIGRLTPVNSVSHPFWHSPDRGASHVYSEAVLDNKAVVCHFVSVWMEAPVANPFATGASAFFAPSRSLQPLSQPLTPTGHHTAEHLLLSLRPAFQTPTSLCRRLVCHLASTQSATPSAKKQPLRVYQNARLMAITLSPALSQRAGERACIPEHTF